MGAPKAVAALALHTNPRIVTARGQPVLLDSDLAALYGVSTKALNQAVKRNSARFPRDFAFRLTPAELSALRSQIVTSSQGRGGRRTLPWAFTEHGALMAASVLNSLRAVEMSVFVVRAFVRLRELAKGHAEIAHKLSELERRVAGHDEDLTALFSALRALVEPPAEARREIGFERESHRRDIN